MSAKKGCMFDGHQKAKLIFRKQEGVTAFRIDRVKDLPKIELKMPLINFWMAIVFFVFDNGE